MAKFTGVIRQENVIRFIGSPSQDGQAATIIFENLLVAVGGPGDKTLVATQLISFTFPTTENTTDFHVRLIIRGFVQTSPGARAILLGHLGDTTALVPLPADSTEGKDYTQELEATLPAGVDVQTTLFLLAERNSVDQNLGALLTVDTTDVAIDTYS